MTSTLPLADTRDMIGLNEVFRQALASPYAARVPEGDTKRAELVGTYLDNALRLLHAHHDGEDELMTPRLLQRCTPDEAHVVNQIAGMHVEVMADIVAAETTLNRWQTTASATHRDATVTALNTLNASLTPHLDLGPRVGIAFGGRGAL